MIRQKSENSDISKTHAGESCAVCKDLLMHMERFFDIPQNASKTAKSDWLTVDDIATELRISKTIVYRLIRNGEIEAVNVVENNSKITRKGHYRIKRQSVDNYLEARKVKPLPGKPTHSCRQRNWPKVKNHLGL